MLETLSRYRLKGRYKNLSNKRQVPKTSFRCEFAFFVIPAGMVYRLMIENREGTLDGVRSFEEKLRRSNIGSIHGARS